MSVRLMLRDGTLTAFLGGEIDDHMAREMRETIDMTAEKVKPRRIKLDFAEVPFMDSAGIGLIMGRYKLLAIWNGQLQLANMSPRIELLVKLAGVDRLAVIERGENNESGK